MIGRGSIVCDRDGRIALVVKARGESFVAVRFDAQGKPARCPDERCGARCATWCALNPRRGYTLQQLREVHARDAAGYVAAGLIDEGVVAGVPDNGELVAYLASIRLVQQRAEGWTEAQRATDSARLVAMQAAAATDAELARAVKHLGPGFALWACACEEVRQ